MSENPTHYSIEAVVKAIDSVEDAELFEDGVSGDLADGGIKTLADAYMTGRQDAMAELRIELGLPR